MEVSVKRIRVGVLIVRLVKKIFRVDDADPVSDALVIVGPNRFAVDKVYIQGDDLHVVADATEDAEGCCGVQFHSFFVMHEVPICMTSVDTVDIDIPLEKIHLLKKPK